MKFIHCPSEEQWEEKKSQFSSDSIVFIKNSKKIWTHDTYYGGPSIVLVESEDAYNNMEKQTGTLYCIPE